MGGSILQKQGEELSVMAKVLFLLCVPEEVGETENAKKVKKESPNGPDKTVKTETDDLAHPLTKSSPNVDESAVDSNVQLSQQTDLLPEFPQRDNAKDVAVAATGQEATDVKEVKDTLQNVEDISKSNLLTNKLKANMLPAEGEKPREVTEPKTSIPFFENSAVQSAQEENAAESEQTSASQESKVDKPEGAAIPQTDMKKVDGDNLATPLKKVLASVSLEEEPLLNKCMIGKELTDDFWDFGCAKAETASESKQEEAKLKGDIEDQTQQIPDSEKGGNSSAGKITADKDSPSKDSNSKSPSRNKTQPMTDNSKQNIALSTDSEKSNKSKDQDGKKQENEATVTDESEFVTCPNTPNIDRSENVSSRFTTEPVEDVKPANEKVTPPAGMKEVSLPSEVGSEPVTFPAVKRPSADSETLAPTSCSQPPAMKREKSFGAQSLAETIEEDDTGTEWIDFLPKLSLRKKVRECLCDFGVTNVAWQKCIGDKVWQVTFVEEAGKRCEDIMLKLEGIGLGRIQKSSISVCPVTIHCEQSSKPEEKEETPEEDKQSSNSAEKIKMQQIEEKTSEFHKSIKSRLVVQQVVKSVEGNAEFTFDYLMLIILASIIASLGLVENSSVILVASMLISPLMGPILAGTFGTVIKNIELRNLGIRSELKGLGICVLCGFVCGLLTAGLEAGSLHWRSSDEWPTIEMSSRGVTRGLLVGMMIALPSGAGVALSVLGGNTGSLVGVAISASLLPPAVNAGMLWSSAMIAAISPPALVMKSENRIVLEMSNGTLVNRTEVIQTPVMRDTHGGLQCPLIANNEYVHTFSCTASLDFLTLGVISLLLTILNIFCIFIMGIIVLKVKEVAPKTSTQIDENFFHNDIKVARESYTTSKGSQSAVMGRKWLEEYKTLKRQMELGDIEEEDDTIEFQHILQSVENSPDVKNVLGRMSRSQPVSDEMASVFMKAAVSHIQKHPESVYHTLSLPHRPKSGLYPRKSASIYGNLHSPIFSFPQSPLLLTPEMPSTPIFYSATHLPLAPINEDEGPSEESSSKTRLRLNIPRVKHFQVTRLSEKRSASNEPSQGASNVAKLDSDQSLATKEPKKGKDLQPSPKKKTTRRKSKDEEAVPLMRVKLRGKKKNSGPDAADA